MQEPVLQFKPGQREFYEGDVADQTGELLEVLETLRSSWITSPTPEKNSLRAAEELPHCKDQVRDAFLARAIVGILDRFADRINDVGFAGEQDAYEWLQHVDLSAAKEDRGPIIDDAAIRESFIDSGDATGTEKQIAREGDQADDERIRSSAGIPDADKRLADAAKEEVDAITRDKGPRGRNPIDTGDDYLEGRESGDQGESGGGGEGSDRVQTGTLYADGSDSDPITRARKAAKLLFEKVLDGVKDRHPLGLRMRILAMYGVMTRDDIRNLMQSIRRKMLKFNSAI